MGYRVLSLMFWGALAPVCCAQSQYSFQEIGPSPLLVMNIFDLGPQGQAIGRTFDFNVSPPLCRAIVWHNGAFTMLDGPGGETFTEARCMDDNGVVYGAYTDRRLYPVRWVDGVPQPYSNSESVNSSLIFDVSPTTGVAVGWAKPYVYGTLGWRGEYGYANEMDFTDGDPVIAYTWSGDTGRSLFRGQRMTGDGAVGVNDAGQIAISFSGNELNGAGIYDPRFGAVLLPSFGVGLPNAGWSTNAAAINESGQVVGRAQVAGGLEHPVRWDRDVITDLGLLPGFVEGEARDINDSGVVVGSLATQTFEFGVSPAAGFVYVNGTMYNLNPLIVGAGFVVTEAVAVNNAGQILVSTTLSPRRFALLTPIP